MTVFKELRPVQYELEELSRLRFILVSHAGAVITSYDHGSKITVTFKGMEAANGPYSVATLVEAREFIRAYRRLRGT